MDVPSAKYSLHIRKQLSSGEDGASNTMYVHIFFGEIWVISRDDVLFGVI